MGNRRLVKRKGTKEKESPQKRSKPALVLVSPTVEVECDDDCEAVASESDSVEEVLEGSTSSKKIRKKQFRWNKTSDLALVAEVENVKPFLECGGARTEAWKTIAETINKIFDGAEIDGKRARLHFELLLTAFKKEDFMTRYKSGTEEEFTDLKEKLSGLANLINDNRVVVEDETSRKQNKLQTEKTIAEEIRNAALNTTKSDREDPDLAATPRRVTHKSVMDAWKEKQDEDRKFNIMVSEKASSEKKEDRELEKMKIQLEQDKLDVERQRLELQRQKQNADLELQNERFQLERDERKHQLKTNQALLDILVSKLK